MNRYQVPREEPVTGRTCHNTVSNDMIVGLNLATRIEVRFAADPPAQLLTIINYSIKLCARLSRKLLRAGVR